MYFFYFNKKYLGKSEGQTIEKQAFIKRNLKIIKRYQSKKIFFSNFFLRNKSKNKIKPFKKHKKNC